MIDFNEEFDDEDIYVYDDTQTTTSKPTIDDEYAEFLESEPQKLNYEEQEQVFRTDFKDTQRVGGERITLLGAMGKAQQQIRSSKDKALEELGKNLDSTQLSKIGDETREEILTLAANIEYLERYNSLILILALYAKVRKLDINKKNFDKIVNDFGIQDQSADLLRYIRKFK
jgi:hypothetical protein